MLRFFQVCLFASLVFFTTNVVVLAEELADWADPALPNKEGLILWLDATRPKALLDDAGNPVEKASAPIATWLDASSSKLRLEQKTAASQPTLAVENKSRSVRFNGDKAFLQAETSQSQKDLTIFLVATPRSNAGGFRAFLAASKEDANDYLTGFNLDMGMVPTSDFAMLNYEGIGAPGIKNLKPIATDFGRPHLLSISSTPGPEGVKLRVNGTSGDSKARTESLISLENLFVGGRYFSGRGSPEPTGFLDGDIAEVIVFNRVLDAAQIAAIEKYLITKHGDMTKGPTVAENEKNAKGTDWADPALPSQSGLIVWLDATRPEALLDDAGNPVAKSGAPIATWLDASPSKLRIEQKAAASRPKLEIGKEFRTVRFNGDKAFLQGKLPRSQKNLTIFLVAAPHANTGAFRAFLAGSRPNANDYVTGFNLDMGMGATRNFAMLNYEGSGVRGIKNLKPKATEFSRLHLLSISSTPGAQGVKLRVNGAPADSRDRAESTISLETLIVGGRHFRGDGKGEPTGFLDGDIAEILIFNQVLDDAQIAAFEKYLTTKHGSMREVKRPPKDTEIKPLSYVPPVQMFVPGFRARELPIDLTNINNLKYRADGKLVALAYNGNAYLLTDSDGDKIEDHAELFWDNQGQIQNPIGMALTPPNYPQGNGFFTASKGKLSLVVDTDGDDRADRHEVLADGWTQISHGVDALGVAYDDRDGSVYFGLGTAAHTNGYLLDEQGKSQYDIASERGTIMRVDPRTKLREIVCTGIRYPVAMAFNRNHDLFCTDQEGATWLPNGNPFDELLHIEPKRHYGFPPRHPRHLPNVVDEPNVCDYFPQHQSTCGLNFNEPVNGGPVFGPASWQSDAFVCGYTRGKLYRTQLIKTPHGYVSRNHLVGSLNMLTCDACVSPSGDLLIATHSGGPDWGSGPNGKGKLYNVRHEQPELPQPLVIWPQNAREVHVAFDRPLEPQHLQELRSGMRLSYGKYVAAGDRFEVLRPGYQVVLNQMNTPRNDLQIFGVGVTPDRRTLVISTAPHPQQVSYAITIPALGRPKKPKSGDIRQYPETDLAYDLSGIAAHWQGNDGSQEWSGWLPHLDLEVAKQFTAGSAAHDGLWQAAERGGKWTLETALNLDQMLRPAVQPGSRVDAVLPPELVTLELRSRFPMLIEGTAFSNISHAEQNGMHVATLELSENRSGLAPLSITFKTPADSALSIAFRTSDDSRLRALPLARFMLPWAAKLESEAPKTAEPSLPPMLAGGNWSRGRKVFFGEQAACSKCHKYGGFGETVGPDLSNLPHRDYASVMRDIEQPSFAINPDHLSHNISLTDGRALNGMIRAKDKHLLVTDAQARTVSIAQDQVESVTPSAKSIMPEGLPKVLGPERMRDLLTFLLTPAPSMPLSDLEPPAVRSRAEVESVLAGARPLENSSPRPLKIVLVAGKKDHGPGEHDYPAWLQVWSKLLSLGEATQISTAMDWPTADDFRSADVIVFYQQGKWTPERSAAIDAYLARGGGLVYLHYAVDGGPDPVGMAQRTGLAWRGGHSKFREGPLELEFRDPAHPIARNFSRVHFHDESYWQLVGNSSRIHLLATALEENQQQPQVWTSELGKGRIFVSLLGHYSWTFDDPLFRVLVLRGTAWAANEPVDRFNDLVYPGARVQSPSVESNSPEKH